MAIARLELKVKVIDRRQTWSVWPRSSTANSCSSGKYEITETQAANLTDACQYTQDDQDRKVAGCREYWRQDRQNGDQRLAGKHGQLAAEFHRQNSADKRHEHIAVVDRTEYDALLSGGPLENATLLQAPSKD